MSDDVRSAVTGLIREDDVVDLALELGGIDSPTGQEGAAAEAVHSFLSAAGFDPRRVGMFPDRPNIATRVRGRGDGTSLLLNGHLDTSIGADDLLTTPSAGDRVYHESWREGDRLFGNGVVNNKGLMAAWLIAAKAVRDAGVQLRGDLVLTSVVGEISLEPVDEFEAPETSSKDIGARYLVTRGYTADYAIVAEGTNFAVTYVEAGKVFFKVRVLGVDPPIYTPYVPRPAAGAASPNSIVKAAVVIDAIERWAEGYEIEHNWRGEGGTVVPKVSVNAIRGGMPQKVTKTAAATDLYLDVRINPDQDPRSVERELAAAIAETGVEVEIEPFLFRRGYQAVGAQPLIDSIRTAHASVLGGEPSEPLIPHTSMWRDSNVFNEVGIPTVCYGPGVSTAGGKFAIDIAALVAAANVYALTILEVCGVAD